MKIWVLALLVGLGALPIRGAVTPLPKLNKEQLQQRLQGDLTAVKVYRDGLRQVLAFTASKPELFPNERLKEPRLLKREDKEAVWETWKRFLDYLLALDALGRYHQDFLLLKGEAREDSFFTAYSAHLSKYRFSLALVDRLDHDPAFNVLLNEPVPELGLPAGTYSRLKFRFLSIVQAREFAAWQAAYKLQKNPRTRGLENSIEEDAQQIWKYARGRGELLTAKNALQIIRRTGFKVWFPVQAGVSEWMGDTKVVRQGRSLISQEQIRLLTAKLEPGDILLERRDWYLSNVGLPGFWPHAALFIGTLEERSKFFDDPQLKVWIQAQGQADGNFEGLLQSKYPSAYALSQQPQEQKHRPRVLEAMSEGVSFTTIEHSAECDSLAVLRPRLAKLEKAAAIVRAFHYAGRPYDFNFDFQTDSEIVCTELVYKAYEPGTDRKGLGFPLSEILGHQVTPANEMVRQFDVQFGTPAQQTDLVVFLDGNERAKKSAEASLETFRASWKRPKWHILVQ